MNITKTPEKERTKGGWSWTKIFLPLGLLPFVLTPAEASAGDSILSSPADPSAQDLVVVIPQNLLGVEEKKENSWKDFATAEDLAKEKLKKLSNFKGSRVAPTVAPPTKEVQAEMVNCFISHLKNMDDKAALEMWKDNKSIADYSNEKGEQPLHQSFKYVRPLVVYRLLNKIPPNYLETGEGTTKNRTCADWLNARNEAFEYKEKLGGRSAEQYEQDANKCYQMLFKIEEQAMERAWEAAREKVMKARKEMEAARKEIGAVWEEREEGKAAAAVRKIIGKEIKRKEWGMRESWEVGNWEVDMNGIEWSIKNGLESEIRKMETEWKEIVEEFEEREEKLEAARKEWEAAWAKVKREMTAEMVRIDKAAGEERKLKRKLKRMQKQYEVGIVPAICQNPNSRIKLPFDAEQKIQGYLS